MSKTRLMLDDRINLRAAINKNYSLKECAKLLKKSRSTIYREIVNNSYYKQCRHTCYHCFKNCPILKPFTSIILIFASLIRLSYSLFSLLMLSSVSPVLSCVSISLFLPKIESLNRNNRFKSIFTSE